MAGDTESRDKKTERRGLLPPTFVSVVGSSMSFGAMMGVFGLVGGGVLGLMRNHRPGSLSFAGGGQFFILGTTYWIARSMLLKAWNKEHSPTPNERFMASTIAGAATGLATGLRRGPQNVIPGAIMFAIFGGGGQFLVSRFEKQDWTPKETSLLESKWSPLRKLSDNEYKDLMDEKILRLDAEIALIDEKIAELRAADKLAAESAAQNGKVEGGKGEGQ